MSNALFSLAPGFSRVMNGHERTSRFNGLPAAGKPLKRFCAHSAIFTGLKPGANEIVPLIVQGEEMP